MSNVVNTSSALEGMTLDQWLVERDKVVGQVKRLIHLWFENDLGTHRECAKHLGCTQSTVTYHRSNLIKSGDLDGEIDQARQTRSFGRISTKPVENSTPTFEPAPIVQKLEPQDELRTIEYTSLAPAPMRNLEPGERTSDLYNSLLPHLELLFKELVIGRPDFTADEWESLYGSINCLLTPCKIKLDHIASVERDRNECIDVDAAEAS